MQYQKIENGLLFAEPDLLRYPRGMRYGSQFTINASYIVVTRCGETPVDYSGPVSVEIRNPENVEYFHVYPEFKPSEDKYIGELDVSENNPFRISMHVKEKRLQTSPGIQDSVVDEHFDVVDDVLYNLGLKPGSFKREYLGPLLEWMRKNLKYVREKGTTYNEGVVDEDGYKNGPRNTIIDGVGNCSRFSCLLNHFVRRLGGYSRNPEGCAIDFYIDGIPIFEPLGENGYGNHVWNEIFMDETWNVVDPTVYIRSPEGLQTRAINRTIDALFIEPPYPVFKFNDKKGIYARIVKLDVKA
ncbi:MAG: transglutaminase domain-containing protein [Candidatus Aenigmarchaeota archaeon]|nr:transglutaminase domain-containing protein [Candidatus Aenigmarchaeota archaeon]